MKMEDVVTQPDGRILEPIFAYALAEHSKATLSSQDMVMALRDFVSAAVETTIIKSEPVETALKSTPNSFGEKLPTSKRQITIDLSDSSPETTKVQKHNGSSSSAGGNDLKKRCYVCGTWTLNQLKLDDTECPHIACSLKCLFRLNPQWVDIKSGLQELERDLKPTPP